MFKRLKTRKKLEESKVFEEATKIDYDKNGRAQISVGLPCADDFFSTYSYLTYEFMNPGVVDYINMCESTIPIKKEISLDIYTEESTTNEEKKRIRSTVKRYHAEQIVLLKKKLNRNTRTGLLWLFGGILILLLEIFLHLSSILAVGVVIDIAGWVFTWDGLEILTSGRSEIKRLLIRNYRLMNAKVHVKKYSRKIQRQYGIGDFEEFDEDEE